MSDQERKIIHIDMDAFFASVEQRDNPQLRGKPLIVGGPADSRGVVATCSYEARQYGVRSAMPSSKAYQLCPSAVFVRPRISVYRQVSQQIKQIFSEYTDLVEPLSLDEAYLDVSELDLFQGSATLMAQEIREKIFQRTALTASAGISYNKFIAKIASDMNKPNGQFVVRPEQGAGFVAKLPVGKFFGVGKVTEAKMHALGIQTGADMRVRSEKELVDYFGKAGHYYYQICRGIDHRPVVNQRVRKSLGSESTFQQDMDRVEDMEVFLFELAESVLAELQQKQIMGYTLTLKVKYADFQQITRSISVSEPLTDIMQFKTLIPLLLQKTDVATRSVRLLGLSVSNLTRDVSRKHDIQLNLFEGL